MKFIKIIELILNFLKGIKRKRIFKIFVTKINKNLIKREN